MKKALLFLIIFCSVCTFPVVAQQIVEGHYGGQKQDVAYSAAATTDGGYIITGLTMSMVDSNGDIIVIKTNAHGDTMWTRIYGGPLLEGGNFVMQTLDGGYMVSGHTQDFGARDCDAYLMKLDQYGNSQWIKAYGGDSDDISYSVVELSGGGYLIGGMTASYGDTGTSLNKHVYLIKTNSLGDTVWTRVYAGPGNEECMSVTGTPDGGFLAVGYSSSWGNGEDDGWLLRLNANGDTLWTRLYKYPGDTHFSKILPTADNGYIIAGNATTTTGGMVQGLAVKLDAAGNEQWRKTYSDPAANIAFHDVAQLPAGNYIFTGISYATPTTGNVYILTSDASGTMMSDEVYGGTNSFAFAIAVQGNNSYLVAGGAAKYGDPAGDLYYMEIDNTIAAHVPTVTAESPRLYPNPVRQQPAIIILPTSHAYQSVSLDVIALDGKVIYSKDNILAKDILIDRNNFPPAQYLFRITCTDGQVYKGRFVVE